MYGHLGNSSRCFSDCSFTGVLFLTFLGKKSLVLSLSFGENFSLYQNIVGGPPAAVSLLLNNSIYESAWMGEWLLSCLFLCVTGDTVGHNQWPSSNYDSPIPQSYFCWQ